MSRPGRALSAVRAAWGLLLLLEPGPVLGLVDRRAASRQVDTDVVRVLGARQVAQAALTALAPTRAVLGLGVAVDALHAASMVGLAAVDPDRRRAGLVDACVAGSFAAGSLRAARKA